MMTQVIQSGDEVWGYLQTWLEIDHLYVVNIALRARHQNQGLGATVMNMIKERAETPGFPVRLSVFKTNQRVVAFYERLGFEIHETTDTGCKMCLFTQPLSGNPNRRERV